MSRRRSSKGLITVFTLGMLYVLLSLDWRGHRPAPPPRLQRSFRAQGDFGVGAARVDLRPGLPAAVAGYSRSRARARESGPLFARALVLGPSAGPVGIVSAEVLEVPESLAARVRERGRDLGLVDVVVAATHTHSSFGGYDSRLLARLAATGSFEQALERHLASRMIEAVESARKAMRPGALRAVQTRLGGVAANRNDRAGGVDDWLTAVEARDGGPGGLLARLVVFGSHATLVPRGSPRLDGDWPGRAMARLEERRAGEEGEVVGLLLQGAMGDTTSRPPEGAGTAEERMGGRVAEAALEALQAAPEAQGHGSLAWAAVELRLPRAQADWAVPGFLRRPAANLLHAAAPRKAEVAVLRLPGLVLLCLPVEPTAAAARVLRERAARFVAPGEAVALVSFAQGYLGYVDVPETVRQGAGEARRMLFEPDLLERIAEAVELGLSETRAR